MSASHEDLFQRIKVEFLQAVEAGNSPNCVELLHNYPEMVEQLNEFFAEVDRIPPHNQPEAATLPPDSSAVDDNATVLSEASDQESATLFPADESLALPMTAGSRKGTRIRYFGDYELLSEIARGGMGVVYKARQVNLNRIVALKMILSGQLASDDDIRRFYTEAEAAANLDHPGVVPIFEIGEHDGQHYFSMGFIEGKSLADRVKDGPLPPKEAASVARKITEAIAYAHEKGVIHRDLKPANVLMDGSGEPKVTDFGLARKLEHDSGLTRTGAVMGTPSYMPPEQAAGKTDEVGPLADVYSLGAVLYCLLTGRPPFQAANPLDTLLQVMEREPVPLTVLNPLVPRDLETICLKCLQKDRLKRYDSAKELAADIDRWQKGEPIKARAVTRTERVWRWVKRNPMVSGFILTTFLSLVFGIIISSYFAVLADQRATNAEEANRIAVETLEAVIFQVQGKLSSIPAARDIRKEILTTAMKELERLSEDQLRTDRVDTAKAVVLVRFAAIIMDVGSDDALGSLETAEKNLQQACEIYSRVSQEDPANLRVHSDWAFALQKSGDLAFMMHNFDRARGMTHEAIIRYRDMRAKEPQNPEWPKQLSYALQIQGDILTATGDIADTRISYRESRELAESLRKQAPEDPEYLDLLITAIEKEADTAFKMKDLGSARTLYDQVLRMNQEYLDADPDNPERMTSMSICCERIGDFEFASGQPEKAVEMYQRELNIAVKALEADPKNRRYQEELSIPLDKLTKSLLRLNREEEAKTVVEKTTRILSNVRSQTSK